MIFRRLVGTVSAVSTTRRGPLDALQPLAGLLIRIPIADAVLGQVRAAALDALA